MRAGHVGLPFVICRVVGGDRCGRATGFFDSQQPQRDTIKGWNISAGTNVSVEASFGQSGEIAVTSKAYWLFHLAYPTAVLTLASLAPTPARADFFDDARRTFETDIPHFFQTDVPHFFQDDIPCAFGGQPTSHTKTSCTSSGHPAKHTTDKDRDRAAVSPDETNAVGDVPPSAGR
jgi:hypothetical protein